MKTKKIVNILFGLLCFWGLTLNIFSQSPTTIDDPLKILTRKDDLPKIKGSIEGIVVDESGMGLPGVSITLTSESKTKTTITKPSGMFRFDDLDPGRYDLTTELKGFKTVKKENISPGASSINIVMRFGSEEPRNINTDETTSLELIPQKSSRTPTRERNPVNITEINFDKWEIDSSNPILHGFLPNEKRIVSWAESKVYYSEKKLYARNGVALVGKGLKKDLNDITYFPYKEKDYVKNGISVEKDNVYVVKIVVKSDNQKYLRPMFIRILKVQSKGINCEFYISRYRSL